MGHAEHVRHRRRARSLRRTGRSRPLTLPSTRPRPSLVRPPGLEAPPLRLEDDGTLYPLPGITSLTDPLSEAGGLPGLLAAGRAALDVPPGPHVSRVRLLPPLRPTSVRDFATFEEHVEGVRRSVDGVAGVPEQWYAAPAFYFTTPHAIHGLRLALTAEVNGEKVGEDLLSNMSWTFEEMTAYASRGTRVVPGDVLGSGTCGNGGCLAELWGRRGEQTPPPLKPGDTVTLTVEGISTLTNTVVPGTEPVCLPSARRRGRERP
ncbi:fumarylacetoacetate hydrolase family protein [Streptomyces coelicoflavus]|uniref:Fumarylacetoacetate hydrolase family protein n=1 Tax=Streptomyces coelicoflavus TaxID=285562 RepID=A0A6N9UBK5_9ACTN|nr:fumarylacetoacetate hydrolase family protein [Streptomyces coelicoflavus]